MKALKLNRCDFIGELMKCQIENLHSWLRKFFIKNVFREKYAKTFYIWNSIKKQELL